MRAFVLAVTAVAVCATAVAAQDVATHLTAGDAARCERNGDQALMHYREALALDTANYAANWKASRVLVDIGLSLPKAEKARRDSLYAEARQFAERAVRADPNGADGHYMVAVAIGRVALNMGARERVRLAKVIRDEALRATELNPRHDGALHVLGRWNAEIQRLPGLTKFFARTFLGASIFREATWPNSEMYFNQAVAVEPDNIYHHLDLAETLVDMEKYAEARTQLDRVAQLPLGCDLNDPTYKEQGVALMEHIVRR